jgi:calcineurin-like phosphoesterase family protein
MDQENSINEADENQAETLDKLTGKKIWNVELLEDDKQSMIRIFFSDQEDDYLLIHCEGADLYLVEPKPKAVH